MFKDTKAFSGFAVDDIAAAEQFYGETLGLEVSKGEGGELTLEIAGDRGTLIYPKEDHEPAVYTILNFPVKEIEPAVDELTERGVTFERYEGEIATDEKGIFQGVSRGEGPNIAWFRDPAGNILSVIEQD